MKTMTCKQLGGACDIKFSADTFEQMAKLSSEHGMQMKDDPLHQEAMAKVMQLMQEGKMQEWMEQKRKEFEAL